MGWGSGNVVMDGIIAAAMKHVPKKTRIAFYKDVITVMESADCDTLQECEGKDLLYDEALSELHSYEDFDEDEVQTPSG